MIISRNDLNIDYDGGYGDNPIRIQVLASRRALVDYANQIINALESKDGHSYVPMVNQESGEVGYITIHIKPEQAVKIKEERDREEKESRRIDLENILKQYGGDDEEEDNDDTEISDD